MSDTKTVPIDQATGPQLRAFAQAQLGMTFGQNERVDDIRAKVKVAWDKPEIDVPAEQPQAPRGDAKTPAGEKAVAPGKKVKIIIQRTDGPGGDEPVPVGVNGRVMLIPRGEEVEIPEAYFLVLKNAVQHIYDANKEGGVNSRPRQVPLYPYQRVA